MLTLLRMVLAHPREVRAKANIPPLAKAETAPIACLLNINSACLRTCVVCGREYINFGSPEHTSASLLSDIHPNSINLTSASAYAEDARRFAISYHCVRVFRFLYQPPAQCICRSSVMGPTGSGKSTVSKKTLLSGIDVLDLSYTCFIVHKPLQ